MTSATSVCFGSVSHVGYDCSESAAHRFQLHAAESQPRACSRASRASRTCGLPRPIKGNRAEVEAHVAAAHTASGPATVMRGVGPHESVSREEPQHAAARETAHRHTIVSWPSHGRHMIIAWPSRGRYVNIMTATPTVTPAVIPAAREAAREACAAAVRQPRRCHFE